MEHCERRSRIVLPHPRPLAGGPGAGNAAAPGNRPGRTGGVRPEEVPPVRTAAPSRPLAAQQGTPGAATFFLPRPSPFAQSRRSGRPLPKFLGVDLKLCEQAVKCWPAHSELLGRLTDI